MQRFSKKSFLADFHIHSRYSRATSPQMHPLSINNFAKQKGISVIGSGDFLHPQYLKELQNELMPSEKGLYNCKDDNDSTRFILTTEVSNIYTQGGKTRKIHTMIFVPDFALAMELQKAFDKMGNIKSDGRPIFGFSAKTLVKVVMDISKDCFIVPAHIWTPWFSLFGSKSGFDSIQECFEEETSNIFCLETGLSSDPKMNWQLSKLDGYTLISNSDSHSPQKIGRECNVFSCEMNYFSMINALKNKITGFEGTVEFFPEEGKYHYDGHINCNVCLSPEESKSFNDTCPVCGEKLTIGVLHRLFELSDREYGFVPENSKPFVSIVPLDEIIAAALEVNSASKKVLKEYRRLIDTVGTEMDILLWHDISILEKKLPEKIFEYIKMMREGNLYITPGFDGEYGKVSFIKEIFERKKIINNKKPQNNCQKNLFS